MYSPRISSVLPKSAYQVRNPLPGWEGGLDGSEAQEPAYPVAVGSAGQCCVCKAPADYLGPIGDDRRFCWRHAMEFSLRSGGAAMRFLTVERRFNAETTQILAIPRWHPAPKNALLRNRWARQKLKNADKEMVAAYARLADLRPATGKRRITLRIYLERAKRGCDPDAYWLSLLDALKAAKLIVDDRKECVVLDPVEYHRAEMFATEIILEDI